MAGINSVNNATDDYTAAYAASVSNSMVSDIQNEISDTLKSTDGLTIAAIGNGSVQISATDTTVLANAVKALDETYSATLSTDGTSAIITRVPPDPTATTTSTTDTNYYTDKIPDYGTNTELSALLGSSSGEDSKSILKKIREILAALLASLTGKTATPPPPPPELQTVDTTTVAASSSLESTT